MILQTTEDGFHQKTTLYEENVKRNVATTNKIGNKHRNGRQYCSSAERTGKEMLSMVYEQKQKHKTSTTGKKETEKKTKLQHK